MSGACRRFDLYRIGMEDVERCSAWVSRERVSFTYEDSLRFQRVRKRNTSLFDVLTDVCGLPYTVSGGVLTELLYETLVVDLGQPEGAPYVRCLQPDGKTSRLCPAEELQRTIFRHGFSVTGVPQRQEPVTFVPFVASASMSREGEYLFINRERLDAVLRAVSLDMVCGSGEYVPVISGLPAPMMAGVHRVGLKENERHISPPKLAAYLGLALSDGVSVRELLAARAYRQGLAQQEADAPEDGAPQAEAAEDGRSLWLLGLNENNTICVEDWDSFDMKLSAFSGCWVNRELPMPSRQLALPEKLRRKKGGLPAPGALAGAFGVLAALADDDEKKKNAAFSRFNSLLSDPESPLWAEWRSAARDFFESPGILNLEPGPIPLPEGAAAAQAALNTFAFLYAAAAFMNNGVREFRPGEQETEQGGVLGVTQLLEAIEQYRTEEGARRRLWQTLGERRATRCRVISVTTVPEGIRIRCGTPKDCRYRTELRHITAQNPLNRGKLSDGCGFMEPVLFDRLERLLRGRACRENEEPINAIQLRLPWCKGLLVRFSFNAYLRQWAQNHGAQVCGLTMKDVYGCERPLFDENGNARLQVLFTESMFKGANWFRHLEGVEDRWALYWERLRAHGASILIAGKSTPSAMESRLNYQFLSTIGLKPQEAWELADKRMNLLAKAKTDDDVLAQLLSGAHEEADETDELKDGPVETLWSEDADWPEDESDDLLDGDAYSAMFGRLLRRHPDLMKRTAWVSGKYNSLVQSEILQMMRGRLPVEGDVRYVLPDLLAMIRYIARELVHGPDGEPVSRENVLSGINDLCDDAPQGRYYAPGRRVPWAWRREDRRGEPMEVAILRNPHYASGEEPILQPLPPQAMKEYNLWFGKLTGCIMVPGSALMTLNGADSDGDRVNVCAQQSVIRAIRRRAAQTSQLISQAVRRKGELIGRLQTLAEEAGREDAAAYLTLLAKELKWILPDALPEQKQGRKYSPPLLYAGSDAKGIRYSPGEMQGVHLRDCLWECFCLSRKQKIGVMSLDMLNRAADAYVETDEQFTGATGADRLLAAFMTRYLAASDALDTALEIDMAKTGSSCGRSELKRLCRDVKALFGTDRGCAFRSWRSMYLRYRPGLTGSDFNRRLEELMQEFTQHPPRPIIRGWRGEKQPRLFRSGADAQRLTRLAAGAAARHAAQQPPALMLDGLPETVSRMWRCRRRRMSSHAHNRLHSLLVPPDCPLSGALRAQAEALAEDYESKRWRLRQAEYSQRTVDRSYQDMLHWLLGNGFALDEAAEAAEELARMPARWMADAPEEAADVLRRLEFASREPENAAAWGWASAAGRRRLLTELARAAEADHAGLLTFTERETALLTCGSRSIQLLTHAVAYGRKCAAIADRARITENATPDQLQAGLMEAVGGNTQLYYAAVWHLSGTKRQRGWRNQYFIGDFLTAYLLRDVLHRYIQTMERGGET